jgi:hypothetical protein
MEWNWTSTSWTILKQVLKEYVKHNRYVLDRKDKWVDRTDLKRRFVELESDMAGGVQDVSDRGALIILLRRMMHNSYELHKIFQTLVETENRFWFEMKEIFNIIPIMAGILEKIEQLWDIRQTLDITQLKADFAQEYTGWDPQNQSTLTPSEPGQKVQSYLNSLSNIYKYNT